MYKKLGNDFDKVLRISYSHNCTNMKNEILRCNIFLKITLSERRKEKCRKFNRKKQSVNSQLGSGKVSAFELALKRSKLSNVTDNRKQREKKKN